MSLSWDSSPSVWTESKFVGPPSDFKEDYHEQWHYSLLAREDLCEYVGGRDMAAALGVMLIPAMAWNDVKNRGYALGFPVHDEYGNVINVIRRYLDDKKPRYKGLGGRPHGIWPMKAAHYVPYDVPARDPLGTDEKTGIVLVCGMRDACIARTLGVMAYTYTGGVGNFDQAVSTLHNMVQGRRVTVCFDVGEEPYMLKVAALCKGLGADRVQRRWLKEVAGLQQGNDIADLVERKGKAKAIDFLRRGRGAVMQ